MWENAYLSIKNLKASLVADSSLYSHDSAPLRRQLSALDAGPTPRPNPESTPATNAHKVGKWVVNILLECFLVLFCADYGKLIARNLLG